MIWLVHLGLPFLLVSFNQKRFVVVQGKFVELADECVVSR